MADVDGKQSLISVENADVVCNDADLSTNRSHETGFLVETTSTADEKVDIVVQEGVSVSTQLDGQTTCERIGSDGQSDNSDVANTMKVRRQKRKRSSVLEQIAAADAETPVKRRRVQHNYRRLSRAGYVDDYDGRERFSAKQTTPTRGNRLSVLKSKTVGSLPGPSSRHCASKVTRSGSETGTNATQGQRVSDMI